MTPEIYETNKTQFFEPITQQAQNIENHAIKQVANGTIIVLISKVINTILTYALNVIIGRTIGASNFGLYSLGRNVLDFGRAIGSLGFQSTTVQFITGYRIEQDFKRLKGTIILSLAIPTILSIILGIALWSFSAPLSSAILKQPDLIIILQILSYALPFYVCLWISASLLQAIRRVALQQILTNIVFPFITIIIMLSIVISEGTLKEIVIGFVLSTVICVGISIIIAWKIFRPILIQPGIKFEVGKILGFSLPVFGAGFVYLMLNLIPRFILSMSSDANEVGIYSASINTAQLTSVFLIGSMPMAAPLMTELYHTKKIAELELLFQVVSRWTLILTFPILIIFILGAKLIMNLYGNEFKGAEYSLIYLCCGQMFNAGTGPINKLLEIYGKQTINLWLVSLNLVMSLFLCYWMVPYYGAIGAAIATSIATAVSFTASAIFSSYNLGIRPYSAEVLRPINIGVLSLSIGLVIDRFILSDSNSATVYNIALSLIIYSLGMSIFGLTAFDKELLIKRFSQFSKSLMNIFASS